MIDLSWVFSKECPIPDDIQGLLVEGETAIKAYKTNRDSAIFTNKRIMFRDVQGLRGKKIEIYSLPYIHVHMWSTENAGGFLDTSSEIELWTRVGNLKIKLDKGVDVRQFDLLIAECVLNSKG